MTERGRRRRQVILISTTVVVLMLLLVAGEQPSSGWYDRELWSSGPRLAIPDQIPAAPAGAVTVPITFTSNGHDIAAVVFSVDYDQTWLIFDPTDNNGDEIPDAITFNLPGGFVSSVSFDETDTDGELDFMIMDFFPPLSALPDRDIVFIQLNVGSPGVTT